MSEYLQSSWLNITSYKCAVSQKIFNTCDCTTDWKLVARNTSHCPDTADCNNYVEEQKGDVCFYPAGGPAEMAYKHLAPSTPYQASTARAWVSLLVEVKTHHADCAFGFAQRDLIADSAELEAAPMESGDVAAMDTVMGTSDLLPQLWVSDPALRLWLPPWSPAHPPLLQRHRTVLPVMRLITLNNPNLLQRARRRTAKQCFSLMAGLPRHHWDRPLSTSIRHHSRSIDYMSSLSMSLQAKLVSSTGITLAPSFLCHLTSRKSHPCFIELSGITLQCPGSMGV